MWLELRKVEGIGEATGLGAQWKQMYNEEFSDYFIDPYYKIPPLSTRLAAP